MTFVNIRTAILIVALLVVAVSSAGAKKLSEHWTLNFTERFRLVTWDNAITLDETAGGTRTFTRHRTQLGAVCSPSTHVSIGVQLANEFRYHVQPSYLDFHLDEVFFDQLYVKLTRPLNLPFTLTVGRQNIILGEGFVVMDGHPLDGSRSIYFNAVRADWHISADHDLTAFASYIEPTDDWLPIIHEQEQALVERPETGYCLYYSGKIPHGSLDLYIVRKETDILQYHLWDIGDGILTSVTNMLGARLEQTVSSTPDVRMVIEGGWQFGERGDRDRSAFGGYGYIQYQPKTTSVRCYVPTSITLGSIFLSGNSVESDKWQDWDPMFARWPKWSESYIYSQIREDAVAWWTNLISAYATTSFTLSPSVSLTVDYHHLWAARAILGESAFLDSHGSHRGDLLISKVSFKMDDHWSGHFLWEGFNPGDYYAASSDSYAWIRAELMFRF